jgi:hypothetical protein
MPLEPFDREWPVSPVNGVARGVTQSAGLGESRAELEKQEAAAKQSPDVLVRNGIVPIASIPRERIDWAWKGRAAFGKHTDVSGDPGDGKSLMLTALAAQVTRGRALPYGSEQVREPRAVLFLSAEDDNADTIRPRFEAADGDVNLLYVQKDAPLILPGDADALREIIEKLHAGMTVIDPAFSYIGDLDPNAYSSAVAVCDPLKRIASETHCMLVTIRHLNKAAGASARYRAGGSIGWQAKPRCVLSLGRDPNERDVRVLSSIKGNVGKEPRAATFRVAEVALDGEQVGRVLWGDECDLTADEVHGAEGVAPKGTTKTQATADYFRERLTAAGPDGLAIDDLRADMARVGLGKGGSTFYAAKRLLGGALVEFRADPDNHRNPLRWRLAMEEAAEP